MPSPYTRPAACQAADPAATRPAGAGTRGPTAKRGTPCEHVRVERLPFDGTLEPDGGVLRPEPDSPGLGIELKRAEAERYAR
jgi:hypothetical protein